jgi:pyruvate dehydrogenase E2 component (dihydrolipoamide acetyltransferase)
MPALGADMEAGTLVEWLVKPGVRVRLGDIIAVVETQKGAIEVEVFQEGVVSNILVPEGERVPVGTVLANIENAPGAASPVLSQNEIAAAPKPTQDALAEPPRPSLSVAPQVPRTKITPAARRRAAALYIDLATVKGTGVEGSIRLADVEAATSAPCATPSVKRGVDLTEMRRAIAAAMSRSKREIPHYYLTETVDLHAASTWTERFNADKAPAQRILPAVLFLKAAALALREWPQFNGVYTGGVFVPP